MKLQMRSVVSVAMGLAVWLSLSACASPLAPSAKPENFYEAVRADVETYWRDTFSSYEGTYSPISKMQFFEGQITTCGESLSGPFYCRTDKTVYLDTEFMQKQMTFGK